MTNATGMLWGFFVLTVINALLFHNAVIGIFTLVGLFYALGTMLRPHFGQGMLMAVCMFSVFGALLYYTLPVSTLGLLVVLGGICVWATILGRRNREQDAHRTSTLLKIDFTLIVLAVIGLLAWWSATLPLAVTEAVRTPWAVAPILSILGLGVSALAGIVLVVRDKHIGAWILVATIFSALTLAVFLYPIGYGFDPFLHRATISHIAEHGTITPKPLYYIGEYALELFALKLFALPLFWTNALLAPLLLVLVLLTMLTLRDRPSALTFLFLPLGAFVSTTPQSLAYIFTLATILFGWQRLAHHTDRWPMYACAVAALITHPLAGIPAAIFIALTETSALPHATVRKTMLAVGTAVASITLPVVFTVQAKLAGLDVGFSLNNIFNLSRLPVDGFLSNHFNTWFDGLYLVIANLFWIVIALAVVGMVIARRSFKAWYVPGLLAAILIINFIILSLAFDFTYLISYERTDFALRLLTLAHLALLPYIGVTFTHILSALKHKPVLLKLSGSALLATLFAATVYGAYPRHDDYARSAGFNVTQTDIDAIHTIANREGDNEYVVLSNQAVAAAAVQEFGFRRYYQEDIFYYPIPTGGPLYQIYLNMVDKMPTRSKAEEAMALTGVNTVYLIVNEYWWKSDQIIENAKREADDWTSLGDGQVTIFRFLGSGLEL